MPERVLARLNLDKQGADLPPIIGPVFMLHQQPGAVKQLGETLPGMGPCNQAHCGV